MISFRNRVVFSTLSIVATAGLVSFSSPAAASDVAVRQTSIATADLNLRNPAGQATFERRAAAAARTVCAEQAPFQTSSEANCRRNAVLQARAAVGLVDDRTSN
ncbi:UrcA family protein [Sphingomonas sp. Mn802worker]|uniref:UrcA family protein n=1 Tax=Sphingomonas sp. Mn802worker TaxID=629773 RepID=UPI000377B5BB|nr:UrcA family protein [Sphingomonas sp. Mn802worker]